MCGKIYFNFVSIPTEQATLFSRVLICSLNFKFLPKMTPKYLALLNYGVRNYIASNTLNIVLSNTHLKLLHTLKLKINT